MVGLEPASSSRSGQLLLLCLLLAFPPGVAGCAFDTTRLDQLTCDMSSGCPGGGSCVAGHCEPVGSRLDADDREPYVDAGEDIVPWDGIDDATVEADGDGDVPVDLVQEVDGPDQSSDPVIEPVCEEPSNACGGCQPLEAVPGEPCPYQRCGIWTCSGTERVICVEGPINECGGCDELTHEVGEPCGCMGHYQCQDGELVCGGTQPLNPCGGCGGPTGQLGDSCLCTSEVDEEHTWTCDGDQLSCEDENGSSGTALELEDTSDDLDGWEGVTGSLVDGETTDWFVVYVSDTAGPDLIPDVALSEFAGTGRNHDLCAFWEYEDGRSISVWCEGGNPTTSGGLPGCCGASAGTADELIGLRNAAGYTNRLDTEIGSDNDNGWLYIQVTGQPGEGCGTYHLQYHF